MLLHWIVVFRRVNYLVVLRHHHHVIILALVSLAAFLASIVLLKTWEPFCRCIMMLNSTCKLSQSFIVTILYNVMLNDAKIDFIATTADMISSKISRCLSHCILTVKLLLGVSGVRMFNFVATLFVSSNMVVVGWYHFFIGRARRIVWKRCLCHVIWGSDRILLLWLFIGTSCPIRHTLSLILLWIIQVATVKTWTTIRCLSLPVIIINLIVIDCEIYISRTKSVIVIRLLWQIVREIIDSIFDTQTTWKHVLVLDAFTSARGKQLIILLLH